MSLQRLRPKTGLAAAGMLLCAGCGVGEVFDLYPEAESPAVAGAPWPTLLETVERERASGRPLDPATGAGVVEDLSVEAALARADSDRLSPPVIDSGPLRADAAAARAGR